jgi:hypothetical protein
MSFNSISQSSASSEPIYPQALLDAMAGNEEPSYSPPVDQSMKHDFEAIIRNLSKADDALFYLKTTSEIIKKWPTDKVRIFMQNLLKQAMDDDNKMRLTSD